jgi:Sec-independent protein translocase protein TatA
LLSPADMLLIGAAALIFFGPDQLPKVAKRAGQVVREVQNTSQSFIREMERAADDIERRERYAADLSTATPVAEPDPFPETRLDHDEHDAGFNSDADRPIEIIEPDHKAEAVPKPVAAAPPNFEI